LPTMAYILHYRYKSTNDGVDN